MEELDKSQEAHWAKTVDVYVQVSFTKIYDVDTVNQRFQAEAIIESKWYNPSIKSLDDNGVQMKMWKPELYIENTINDVKEETWYRLIHDKDEVPMIYEIRKVKGLFWEKLELENFPLDKQDLTLVIATKKSGTRINLILTQPETHGLNISNTLDSSMWELLNVVKSTRHNIHREFSYGKREYPAIRVTAQALRNPGFFYWNAVLPILLITLASLGPFVIDYKLPQSRLPSTATMLLTSVSFKWVVGRLLPTVSYLTSLDRYSLASLLIITAQLLYHAIIAAVHNSLPEILVYSIDKFAFMIFLTAIFLKQAFFVLWVLKVNKAREELKQNYLKSQNKTDLTTTTATTTSESKKVD